MDLVVKFHRYLERKPNVVLWLFLIGFLFELTFWYISPPNWRLSAVYYPLNFDPIWYISDFSGYKHSRMPFFDVISMTSWFLLSGVLEQKSLTVFNLVVSVVSLPLFYTAVSRLFNDDIATYSLVFYLLYPKRIVINSLGMPEAASVSLLVFALYSVVRAVDTDGLRWYAVGGIFGTIAYLVYVPSVLASIFMFIFVYLDTIFDENKINGLKHFLPGRFSLTYAVVPGIIGICYLVFGPVRKMMKTASGEFGAAKNEMFSNPELYSLVEKISRYVAYAFYDFWWHGLGFEAESQIFASLVGYRSLLGDLFGMYIFGWTVITLTLTIPIIIGIHMLGRRHWSPIKITILLWAAFYLTIYNARNAGFEGVFNTRHMLPILIPLSIAFGFGVATVLPRTEQRFRKIKQLTSGLLSKRIIFVSICLLLFGILIANGAAQTVATNQTYEVSGKQAVSLLQSHAEPKDTVAVINFGTYHSVIINSAFKIQPVIITQKAEQTRAKRLRTVRADIRQLSPEQFAAQSDIDYLFVVESNKGEFTDKQFRYIETTSNEGVVIENKTSIREWPQNRKVNIAVIEFS